MVADWVVTQIAAGIAGGRFSTASVARANSVNIAREQLDPNEIRIFVTGLDIDPEALRDADLTEETTRTIVTVAKRVTNPSDNAASDPIIDQVGAIFRWFIAAGDFAVGATTRRIDKANSELVTLLDDDLLYDKQIAVGGFVLAFVDELSPEE